MVSRTLLRMRDDPVFTVAIIEDEPLARKLVRDLMRDSHELRVVAESGSVLEAAELLDREHPDIIFLDVQLVDGTGFDVLAELHEPLSGILIFMTAYDRHAVQAFEVHAVDYLLKPVNRARFDTSVARAKELLLRDNTPPRTDVSTLIQDAGARARPRRLAISLEDDRVILVNVTDVDSIESAGNYVRLHIGTTSYLFRETMSALERKLDPEQFVRVHRSAIVNLDRVKELERNAYGDYVLLLQTGATISLSRRYRDRISLLLGKL